MSGSEPRPVTHERPREIEGRVRAAMTTGDVDGAASLAIDHYGAELYGFLCALARDGDLAADAFAEASEALWRGLPAFRWEASVRTWAYQLARNALHRLRRAPHRKAERNLPLSVATSIAAIPRSSTSPHQKSSVKDAMRVLRESLDPDAHELLILRLDRGMSWKDIARATAEGELSALALTQRAATLRKQFERTKDQLKELAIAQGLFAE